MFLAYHVLIFLERKQLSGERMSQLEDLYQFQNSFLLMKLTTFSSIKQLFPPELAPGDNLQTGL